MLRTHSGAANLADGHHVRTATIGRRRGKGSTPIGVATGSTSHCADGRENSAADDRRPGLAAIAETAACGHRAPTVGLDGWLSPADARRGRSGPGRRPRRRMIGTSFWRPDRHRRLPPSHAPIAWSIGHVVCHDRSRQDVGRRGASTPATRAAGVSATRPPCASRQRCPICPQMCSTPSIVTRPPVPLTRARISLSSTTVRTSAAARCSRRSAIDSDTRSNTKSTPQQRCRWWISATEIHRGRHRRDGRTRRRARSRIRWVRRSRERTGGPTVARRLVEASEGPVDHGRPLPQSRSRRGRDGWVQGRHRSSTGPASTSVSTSTHLSRS